MTEKHAELRVEKRDLSTLRPHPENPRKHPRPGSAEWKTLEASLGHDYFDPIVFNERNDYLVSGHLRTKVLLHLGFKTADVAIVNYDDDTHRARLLAANASSGKDDKDKLSELFDSLRASKVDPVLAMLKALPPAAPVSAGKESAPDESDGEAYARRWGVELGQVWQLGAHRLAVGECRDSALLSRLMGGEFAACIHADPPYGMGKEKDGILNDNLYGGKLDAFQMEWWRSVRPFALDTASAYIWGAAADLWRFWYRGGLAESEYLELRNEIVWDKGSTPGMTWDNMTQFPVASERCLFFQFGRQFFDNVNQDSYWEGWDVLLQPLQAAAAAAGLTPTLCKEITGVGMFAHWFSKSQWQFIREKYYNKLRAAYPECFTATHEELRATYEKIKAGYAEYFKEKLNGMRAHFDNSHSIMKDVWTFGRVTGEDRYGHATPKPVDMMERVLLTSVPAGGIVLCHFGGTGPEIIAAEKNGLRYRGVEIEPAYAATIIERWHRLTGKAPEIQNETVSP